MKKEIDKSLPMYSKGEEIFNAVTHIVGGGFGIIVLLLCTIFGVKNNHSPLEIFGFVIYGISMILLYTMSSIYHFLRRNKAKKLFRIFDHCTIYFLIAGTYTPICLSVLKNNIWGNIILGLVWICSIIGIVFNAINMHKKSIKILSMILYVVMGWCIILAIKPLLDSWSIQGFMWMLVGGIAYTVGIIFYGLGKNHKYIHSIWHLFVLLGTILQFIAIFVYIIL